MAATSPAAATDVDQLCAATVRTLAMDPQTGTGGAHLAGAAVTTLAISGDMVWNEDPTTPDEIASTLRRLLVECQAHSSGCVPARVLNLV
jgi:hypothetical protein